VEPEQTAIYEKHYENAALISTEPGEVFDFITDHTPLALHMNKSSWMMGGGHMYISVDDGLGQKVGSLIRMALYTIR
jgi:hypothetical protein